MAAEALALHIEAMVADRDPISEPFTLDQIMRDPNNRDATVSLVDVGTAG